MQTNSFDPSKGLKFYFNTTKDQERIKKDVILPPLINNVRSVKQRQRKVHSTPSNLKKKRKHHVYVNSVSAKMTSRSSTYKEEISSVSSVSALPPITIQRADNRTDRSETPLLYDASPVSDNRMLFVPSTTPDSKYESAELQKRLGSPDCFQCQLEKEKRERAVITANRKSKEKNNDRKSANGKSINRKVIKVPNAFSEVTSDITDTTTAQNKRSARRLTEKQLNDLAAPKSLSGKSLFQRKEPQSSRTFPNIPDYKNKRLYNSWEGGLHKYHIEEENESDEEPLIFRFKLKDSIEEHSNKKRTRTPPKSPFHGTILTNIENRRFEKVKTAKAFSSYGEPLKGKPVAEDSEEQPYAEIQRVQRFNVPKEPAFMGKLRAIPPKRETYEGMEKGSQIFLKKSGKEKIQRPFLPSVDEKPHVARGRTIMRNPMAPVSFQQRFKPVVVLKSKLDDYSEAIREFLECIIEEQRMSFEERKPAALDQSSENMVIYKDIDEIDDMKEMAKAMKLGLAKLNKQGGKGQISFKSQGLAKGTTRIKKIGALDTGLDGYRYRSPQKMSVGGQSIFLTAPNNTFITAPNHTDIESVAANNIPYDRNIDTVVTDPKEHSRYMLYAGNSKTTMVPPNTPYEHRRLTTTGLDGE